MMISFLAVIEVCIHIVQCSLCTLILFTAQIDFQKLDSGTKTILVARFLMVARNPQTKKYVCIVHIFVCVKVIIGGWGS